MSPEERAFWDAIAFVIVVLFALALGSALHGG